MGEPDDGVVENERGERFGFAPFNGQDARCPNDDASRRRDAVAESVVGIFGRRLVVGGGRDEAAEGVVDVGRGKNCAAEAAALFADGLAEEVLVALGEAGGIGGAYASLIDATRDRRRGRRRI